MQDDKESRSVKASSTQSSISKSSAQAFEVSSREAQLAEENQESSHLQTLNDRFNLIINEPDVFRRESALVKVSKQLNLPLEQVHRLFDLYELKTLRHKDKSLLSWVGQFWLRVRRKTAWDWMQLLIVPIILAGATWYLQDQAKRREDALKTDKERQETLNKYYEFISTLLSKESQESSESSQNASEDVKFETSKWIIARARTLTALQELDNPRKVQLLSFLNEAKLINRGDPRIKLVDADLRNLNLKKTALCGVSLRGANLSGADLRNSLLIQTDLSETNLSSARIDNADLTGATLERAQFQPEQFKSTTFCHGLPDKGELNRACPYSKESFGGYVDTYSATGVNVRYGPGFNYPVFGRLTDGIALEYGNVVYIDGFSWGRLSDGAWVITDYISEEEKAK
ncbi:MAG: pentapeptide repeat-containing protein [Leptolyngbyaceae cyanobacterium bins.302]|nr:pentapeptide repeat-containing protein [Leptolyngbyaceae cyanobacterium bins.302]